jgi:hypothetical protein
VLTRVNTRPPLDRDLPVPPVWALSPVIVGVFAVDLHKLAINTISMLLENPRGWEPVARGADVALAVVLIVLCFAQAKRLLTVPAAVLAPLAAQLLLAAVITLALFRHFDEISFLHYERYMGGNFALFAGAFLICADERRIRLTWRVWCVASVIMSLLAVWYWVHGIGWDSSRSQLVPGTGVRMGYHCCLAVVYCLYSRDSLLPLVRIPLLALLVFAVFTSGSKAALLLTIGVLAVAAVGSLNSRQRTSACRFLLVLFLGVCGVATAMLILSGKEFGFYADAFDLQSYRDGYGTRLELLEYYTHVGMQNPWLGSGIAAAYDAYDIRTHSVVQALFVQTGLLGPALYLLFAGWLVVNGYKALRSKSAHGVRQDLFVATFLATLVLFAKAEMTGDIPGNRELWCFCGLLLAAIAQRMRASRAGLGALALPPAWNATSGLRRVPEPRTAFLRRVGRKAPDLRPAHRRAIPSSTLRRVSGRPPRMDELNTRAESRRSCAE